MKTFLSLATLMLVGTAHAGVSHTVTFDAGAEGWSINGWDQPDLAGGNPGANLHWDDFVDTFGLTLANDTDPRFLGDYTARGPVRLAVDADVTYIQFFGQPVSRDLVVELRDYDDPPSGYPYVSVWYSLGALPAPAAGWVERAVDILDPSSASLPPGWGGTGAEDPDTFEPVLPADRTFASVLASVDQLVFTTFVPGFFYGFTNFDVAFDNVSIKPLGGAGRVPDGADAPGAPLVVAKLGGDVRLDWSASCVATDTDYVVYEGVLGSFASHQPVVCSTLGATDWTLTPGAANRYYVVAPRNAGSEGSVGVDSSGNERPPGTAACVSRAILPCP